MDELKRTILQVLNDGRYRTPVYVAEPFGYSYNNVLQAMTELANDGQLRKHPSRLMFRLPIC